MKSRITAEIEVEFDSKHIPFRFGGKVEESEKEGYEISNHEIKIMIGNVEYSANSMNELMWLIEKKYDDAILEAVRQDKDDQDVDNFRGVEV